MRSFFSRGSTTLVGQSAVPAVERWVVEARRFQCFSRSELREIEDHLEQICSASETSSSFEHLCDVFGKPGAVALEHVRTNPWRLLRGVPLATAVLGLAAGAAALAVQLDRGVLVESTRTISGDLLVQEFGPADGSTGELQWARDEIGRHLGAGGTASLVLFSEMDIVAQDGAPHRVFVQGIFPEQSFPGLRERVARSLRSTSGASVVVTAALAESAGLEVGQTLRLVYGNRAHEVVVSDIVRSGVYDSTPELVFVDIEVARSLAGPLFVTTGVEVFLNEPSRVAGVADDIAKLVGGPSITVTSWPALHQSIVRLADFQLRWVIMPLLLLSLLSMALGVARVAWRYRQLTSQIG